MMTTRPDPLRCRSCGSQIMYEVDRQLVTCPHCSTPNHPPQKATVRGVPEQDLEALLGEQQAKGDVHLCELTLCCQSCGAQTAHSSQIKVVDCPFCTSTLVRDETDNRSVFQPEGLIPFKITPDQAAQAIRKWARGLWFRPGRVQKLSRVDEFQGIYVPFWTIDCHSQCRYKGRLQGACSYKETRWFLMFPYEVDAHQNYDEPVSGQRQADYDDLLISASQGLPVEHLAKIEPFSTITELVPYDPRYLSGWAAEESQIGPRQAWEKAEVHLRTVEYRKSVDNVRRDSNDDIDLQVDYTFSKRQGKPVLLPVYVGAFRYGRKTYRVLVNGETGLVSGQAPYDWVKLLLASLLSIPLFFVVTALTGGFDLLIIGAILAFKAYQRFQAYRRERREVTRANSTFVGSAASNGSPPTSALKPRWKRRQRGGERGE